MLFPLFLFAHESLASLSFSRQGSKQCQWWRMVCIYLKTIEKAEKTGRIYFEKHVMNDQTLALAYAIFSRCMHFSLISLFSGGISLAAGLFFMFQSLSTCVYFEKFAFTLKSNLHRYQLVYVQHFLRNRLYIKFTFNYHHYSSEC